MTPMTERSKCLPVAFTHSPSPSGVHSVPFIWVGERSIVISVSVCLSADISGTARPKLANFYKLPTAVLRSPSGGVALSCVFPVL